MIASGIQRKWAKKRAGLYGREIIYRGGGDRVYVDNVSRPATFFCRCLKKYIVSQTHVAPLEIFTLFDFKPLVTSTFCILVRQYNVAVSLYSFGLNVDELHESIS